MFLPDELLSEATSWPVLTVRVCLRGWPGHNPDRPSNLLPRPGLGGPVLGQQRGQLSSP
jgi:hypothetical protein